MYKKIHKYHAQKTEIDGITFASKKEARRYAELKLLEQAGKIKDLQLQPRFCLQDGFVYQGKKIRQIEYVADFQYLIGDVWIVEDCKGMRTEIYKIKKKIFLKKYGHCYFFRET
ncbi:MAG: DUF1064 domain-containing protein [Elusimicrobiota bacterium]|nr:DUF1064 domain-containing protein [Elusimicrobiota bacterium]